MKKTMTKLSAIALVGLGLSSTAHSGETLTTVGDNLQWMIPFGAAGYSLFQRDGEGFMQAIEGATYTAAATHLLKFAIDADRPDGSANNSFPSGHTSAATQGAAFLTFRYGWEVGLPAYALAGVVGYSRVEAERHYWRDVAAGAALATGIQYAITRAGFSATNYVFVPYFEGDSYGIAFNMNF